MEMDAVFHTKSFDMGAILVKKIFGSGSYFIEKKWKKKGKISCFEVVNHLQFI